MTRVLVPLAHGFEEIEAVTIIDVLRRAEVEVVTASLEGEEALGAHGIALRADAPLDALLSERFELSVLPGGLPGATTLRDDERVQGLLHTQLTEGRSVAAICAAPIALEPCGWAEGRALTCYPGFAAQIPSATPSEESVTVADRCTTSRGPGTAMAFALRLVAQLEGEAKADELAEAMLVTGSD